jgi:hypothetical protein
MSAMEMVDVVEEIERFEQERAAFVLDEAYFLDLARE